MAFNYMTEKKTAVKEIISQTILDEKERTAVDQKVYNEVDAKYFGFLIKQIEKARIQRETPSKFFDDMNFTQAYLSNQDAANTYLQKKKNTTEIRVNTGTTEKKVETIWNELNSLNIKSKIYAFDEQDNEEAEVAQSMTNIVRRTNQIENDEEFWSDFVRELLTQPAAFIYETYQQKLVYDKRKKGVFKYKWARCQKQLLSGLQVYLGDITIPARRFQEQPYIVIQEKMSYNEARQIYGENVNWEYVKAGRTGTMASLFDYKLLEGTVTSESENDGVEVIHYFNAPDDEYNCLVNGVMMYAAGEKLPYEKEGYNLEMIVLKPVSTTFAYGKALVASAKYLQALDNETIRLFIRKFRQAINPPIGVMKGRILSKDIFEPGTMHQGITKDSFDKLIDHTGIDNSDVAFGTMVKDLIKEFIGTNDLMSGQESGGNMTATEIIRLQRQALKMLGLSVAALRRAHAKADMLRLYNVIENDTNPIFKRVLGDKVVNVYKKYSLTDTQLPTGETGTYNAQFTDRQFGEEDERQIYLKEIESKEKGKPEIFKFLNVDDLRNIPRIFYAIANSEQEKNGELDKALFSEQLNQAAGIANLTGRRINGDKVIENFERTWGVEDMFMDEGQEMMNPEANPQLGQMDEMIANMEQGGGGETTDQMMKSLGSANKKPSVNTLAK
jgi:hypothetical protein